jgi:hypothetical protein
MPTLRHFGLCDHPTTGAQIAQKKSRDISVLCIINEKLAYWPAFGGLHFRFRMMTHTLLFQPVSRFAC